MPLPSYRVAKTRRGRLQADTEPRFREQAAARHKYTPDSVLSQVFRF